MVVDKPAYGLSQLFSLCEGEEPGHFLNAVRNHSLPNTYLVTYFLKTI